MELIEPSARFIESYAEALIEFDTHGISGFWKSFGPIDSVDLYLQRIKQYDHVAGIECHVVPASVFWLVDNDEFVGHVSVRHSLNAPLRRKGGHIGYAIRPSKQRHGYGTQILGLVLPYVRSLGIQPALVTCDMDNIASRKIIEKNGGIAVNGPEAGDDSILRFWI
jgi:predicted acetyltransferase